MTMDGLAAAARRHGAAFKYREDGTIVTIGLERLPADLRQQVLLRIDDVRRSVARSREAHVAK
ncbi:MAG TPA: hypothetical protein VJP85_05590 [Candidatus Baltobacteraceae bacterium]|nr:hypothetical protein [Candidatus Baltobacteraceae bacterium]